MVKGRTRKLMVGGVFAAIFVAVFMGSFSCKNTSATDFNMSIQSYLSVDFPSFIFIDASPSYTGVQTADATLRVSTNEGGYILIFSADGTKSGPDDTRYTSLVNTSENATIPTLTSSSTRLNFPVGYWGFSIDGGENYRGLTTYDDTNRLVLSSDQPGATDTTDFTFGVKINDVQPAGVYNNTILITTVAKVDDIPEPADINAKALLGDNGHLVFVYDDKQYEVGDAFVNSYTSMAISNIYNVPLYPTDDINTSLPWLSISTSVSNVDFDNSFEHFKPISTKYWFNNFTNLAYINGIEHFNTSRVTDMSFMFQSAFSSRATAPGIRELKKMDVSNVRNMSYMFAYVGSNYASSGDGSRKYGEVLSLSEWDVSNVEDMSNMFYYFSSGTAGHHFIGDLSGWDTSNVKDMSYMFSDLCYNSYACYGYLSSDYDSYTHDNLDLHSWDVGNVISMKGMFSNIQTASRYHESVSINLDGWDVRNVQDISEMFYHCAYDTTIVANNWHLDSLQYGDSLFTAISDDGEKKLTAFLHGWDIGPQANILNRELFGASSYRDIDVDASDWIIRNTDRSTLRNSFNGIGRRIISLNLSNWSIAGTTDLSYAFANNGDIVEMNVSNWDTSSVVNMEGMFSLSYPKKIIGINAWDTGNVINMRKLFYGGDSNDYGDNDDMDFGLESWDVSNVVDMTSMFQHAGLSDRLLRNIEGWNTQNVVSMAKMFKQTAIGERYNDNTPVTIDLTGWDVSKVIDMSEMFANTFIAGGSQIDCSNWSTSSLSNINKMFNKVYLDYGRSGDDDYLGRTNTYLNFDGWDTSRITDMSSLFGDMIVAWSRKDPESTYGGSNSYAYGEGDNVLSLRIGLTGWDTSSVVAMDRMFSSGNNLGYSGAQEEKRGSALGGFVKIIDGITGFNTSNVRTMSHMFEGFTTDPTVWNYDFSNWDTSKVVDMSYMFAGAEAMDNNSRYYTEHFNKIMNVSMNINLDTSAVRNMSHMFHGAGEYADSFTLNLSSLDTGEAQDMSYMLYTTGKNANSYSVNISGWDVSNVINHDYFTDRLDLVQPNWP